MSSFTEADQRILPLALRSAGQFHVATEWYFRGWKPLPYQWFWHHLPVMNTTFIAGIASGKTAIDTVSTAMDCMTIPHFKALSTSVTAKQAELTFEMLMAFVEGNDNISHLIVEKSLRPYPQITFANYSTWEWRTAGMDARFIRGSEYDRIVYDEAALDPRGEIAKVLRGRLRGTRPDGTRRMARLDTITSPGDPIWLKERFYKGIKGHETYNPTYHSMRIETYQNTHLSKEQIQAMEAEYPTDMIDVELRGFFPDYGYTMFPSTHVQACIDLNMYDRLYVAQEGGSPAAERAGYKITEDPRHGITFWETPRLEGRMYIMAGDPGMDNYPRRNAPVVIVADVTDLPRIEIVYFHWVSGKGSYKPFLQSYRYALNKYVPVLRGIDATGPQRMMDELAFEDQGIEVDNIRFGTDKWGMMNALSLDITQHNYSYPPIKGLIRQLSSYTQEDDKDIAQDIVMTMAMVSHLARFVPEDGKHNDRQGSAANYINRRVRTRSRGWR